MKNTDRLSHFLKKEQERKKKRSVSEWFKTDDLPQEVKFKNGSEDSNFRETIKKRFNK